MPVCQYCGKFLERKRYPSGDLECWTNFNKRKYCNQTCMAHAMEKDVCKCVHHSREKAHLHIQKQCALCGATGKLHVHHLNGDPTDNTLSNLMTLCPSCHQKAHSPNFLGASGQRKRCKFCGKPSVKNGLCYTHLERLRRFGHPLVRKIKIGCEWHYRLEVGGRYRPLLPGMLERLHGKGISARGSRGTGTPSSRRRQRKS